MSHQVVWCAAAKPKAIHHRLGSSISQRNWGFLLVHFRGPAVSLSGGPWLEDLYVSKFKPTDFQWNSDNSIQFIDLQNQSYLPNPVQGHDSLYTGLGRFRSLSTLDKSQPGGNIRNNAIHLEVSRVQLRAEFLSVSSPHQTAGSIDSV
jgi:hypothetical protein